MPRDMGKSRENGYPDLSDPAAASSVKKQKNKKGKRRSRKGEDKRRRAAEEKKLDHTPEKGDRKRVPPPDQTEDRHHGDVRQAELEPGDREKAGEKRLKIGKDDRQREERGVISETALSPRPRHSRLLPPERGP